MPNNWVHVNIGTVSPLGPLRHGGDTRSHAVALGVAEVREAIGTEGGPPTQSSVAVHVEEVVGPNREVRG